MTVIASTCCRHSLRLLPADPIASTVGDENVDGLRDLLFFVQSCVRGGRYADAPAVSDSLKYFSTRLNGSETGRAALQFARRMLDPAKPNKFCVSSVMAKPRC